ncbi:transposase [Clostridium beijerinckii]|uniref:hypothetical protein n=1 Tax=Clostridium beijerinckii TaxID=1520 RepID=UPI001570B374|nr:hypothetical protein [Clostridium beijerinckii]NRT34116.1 transposase [Clostridium beijerinckii]NRT46455.1 transposase [Clostridium beijerinckii]NRZ19541.1 transposase [Clostridium beijerinckii]
MISKEVLEQLKIDDLFIFEDRNDILPQLIESGFQDDLAKLVKWSGAGIYKLSFKNSTIEKLNKKEVKAIFGNKIKNPQSTIKTFETSGYVIKDNLGNQICFDLEGNITYSQRKVMQEQINNIYSSSMKLSELKSAVVLYSNDKYDDFLEKFEAPIENLSNDDKAELYKDLYTNVKYQNKTIPNLVLSHYELEGMSSREIKNILDNVEFDDTGEVMVYRGINKYNTIDGSSYTLSEEKAKWFSTRFDDEENVISAKVKLEDIIFYSNDRDEQEVFLNDSKVEEIISNIKSEWDVTPLEPDDMPF